MKKPLDVANGKDLRNKYKIYLVKEKEGKIEGTELFYETREKAIEVANYINNLMPKLLQKQQQYVVEKHNPLAYISYRKKR